MLFPTLKRILHLTSATTPHLLDSAYGADPTYGTLGNEYGVQGCRRMFPVAVTRATGSSMTGVSFKLQMCRDAANPVWIDVPTRLLSATTVTTYTSSNTVNVASASTAEDALIAADEPQMPTLRIVAQSVAADAVAGDSCSAYAWL